VLCEDIRTFQLQESFACGETLGGGDLTDEVQALKGVLKETATHARVLAEAEMAPPQSAK
jgi:hypothetical protein